MLKIKTFYKEEERKAVIKGKDYFLNKSSLAELRRLRVVLNKHIQNKILHITNKKVELQRLDNINFMADKPTPTKKLQNYIAFLEKQLKCMEFVELTITNYIGDLTKTVEVFTDNSSKQSSLTLDNVDDPHLDSLLKERYEFKDRKQKQLYYERKIA